MGKTIVKRYVNVPYIEGPVLKVQRIAAGLSVRQLSDRIHTATGIRIGKSQLARFEKMDEFPVDNQILEAIQRILM